MFRLLILALSTSLLSEPAHACFTPPEGMYISHSEAVDQAGKIYLGTVIRVELNSGFDDSLDPIRPYAFVYTFRVDECLKGVCDEFETRTGDAPIPADPEFYSTGSRLATAKHELSRFWINPYGRVSNWTDCKLHPTFDLGSQYLIFNQNEMSRGQELITSNEDSWLSFVRERIADAEAKPPFPMTASEYFEKAILVAAVDQTGTETQIDVLKGDPETIAFLKGPMEHPDFSGVGECSPRIEEDDSWTPSMRHFLLVVEAEQLGSRYVFFDCKQSLTSIEYYTSSSDKNKTLSEFAFSRMWIEENRVKFPKGLLVKDGTFPLQTDERLNMTMIAVEDLRNILKKEFETPETEQ